MENQVQEQAQKQSSIKPISQQPKTKDNDYAILYENPQSCKLIQLRAGDRYQTTVGAYKHSDMINKPWGSSISAFNKQQIFLNVLNPKSTLITGTLARKTQILYQMDNSAIIFKLNIKLGSIVVEAGTGSGSLSCAISESIGEKGHLFTYEFNKERVEITKKFFEDLKKENITTMWRDVIQDGFEIESKNIKADALFLDVPNPWSAIHHSKKVLKKHGRICCFSPCIEQVQKTTDELKRQNFIKVKTIQCLIRQIYEQELCLEGPESFKRNTSCSVAVHNNRGHTGYLTFGLRI